MAGIRDRRHPPTLPFRGRGDHRSCDNSSRGYIYKLLGNLLYIGRIAHKGETYEGQHPAIVDPETWEAVQAKLAGNVRGHSARPRVTDSSPLLGKLFDESGAPLSPSHAVKSGRRYRYYVSRRLTDGSAAESSDRSGWRVPAREIERIVAEAVTDFFADRATLAEAARNGGMPADRIAPLLDAAAKWDGETQDLVKRVDLGIDRIAIEVNLSPLAGEGAPTVHKVVPMRIRRRGVEMRLVLEAPDCAASQPDPALIKAVVRAHTWFEDLVTGRAQSLGEIARTEGVSNRYIGHLMPLAFLAPDVVEAILDGTQPAGLTAETLVKRTDLPLSWTAQKDLLGFD